MLFHDAQMNLKIFLIISLKIIEIVYNAYNYGKIVYEANQGCVLYCYHRKFSFLSKLIIYRKVFLI